MKGRNFYEKHIQKAYGRGISFCGSDRTWRLCKAQLRKTAVFTDNDFSVNPKRRFFLTINDLGVNRKHRFTSSDNFDSTSKTIYELYSDIKIGGNADKIIIVGDSRVEIMAIDYRYGNMERNPKGFYCGNFNGALSGYYVFAQGGAMFDWMDENITRIDEWIDEGTAIVIAMGVNGCQTLKKQDGTGYESLDEFADRYSSLYGNWIVQNRRNGKKRAL